MFDSIPKEISKGPARANVEKTQRNSYREQLLQGTLKQEIPKELFKKMCKNFQNSFYINSLNRHGKNRYRIHDQIVIKSLTLPLYDTMAISHDITMLNDSYHTHF